MDGIGKTGLSMKLGQGGIGKTDLSLKFVQGIQAEFEYVIWRKLHVKFKDLSIFYVHFLNT